MQFGCRCSVYLGPKRDKLGVTLVIKVVQRSHVLAVADEPVDRREMFPLGKLLVKPPEHLNWEKIAVLGVTF